jgi:hypothetical protein
MAQDGDTIVVSKGVYTENVTFNASNLRILGKKAVVDGTIGTVRGTCFTINGSGTLVQGFTFRNGLTQVQVNGSGSTVAKCRFDSARGTAINAAGASNSTVVDCTVTWPAGSGIVIGSGGSVTGCVVRQYGAAGITGIGSDLRVEKCSVSRGTYGKPIDLFSSSAVVLGNRVSGCLDGISVLGADAEIAGNTVTQIGGSVGLYVDGDDALISGNSVAASPGGISVIGARAQVLGNRIDGPHGENYGIFARSDDMRILGNQVRNGHSYSVGIEANSQSPAGGGAVEDNLVSDIDFSGIEVDGTSIAIRRNRVFNCGDAYYQAGIRILGTTHTIEDSFVQGSRDTGFWIEGNGHALLRCVAKNNSAYGFVLIGNTLTVTDCTGTGHPGAGIVNGGTSLLLVGSTFLGNRQDVTISPYGMSSYDPNSMGNTFNTGGLTVTSDIFQSDD